MRLGATSAVLLLALAIGPAAQAQDTPYEPTAEEIAGRVDTDLASLGSLSLGQPYAGALINGVQLQDDERWHVMHAATAWATAETAAYLALAVDKVRAEFPDSHPLFIGDVGREHGGHLRPHASHQSGRDADISYYYRPGYRNWYQPASPRALDVARSWALVRALVTETDLEAVFIDMRVQKQLYDHAVRIGEDRAWLDGLFGFRQRSQDPLIRHEFGHYTHMHVRFYNPRAQKRALQAYDRLVLRKLLPPRSYIRMPLAVAVPPRRLPPPPEEPADVTVAVGDR